MDEITLRSEMDRISKLVPGVENWSLSTYSFYSNGDGCCAASISVRHGIGDIHFRAATFSAAVAGLEGKVLASLDSRRKDAIRRLALAIISCQADGVADARALRLAGFNDDAIKSYGSEAVIEANTIANNGPFSIIETDDHGANGAPSDEEELAR